MKRLHFRVYALDHACFRCAGVSLFKIDSLRRDRSCMYWGMAKGEIAELLHIRWDVAFIIKDASRTSLEGFLQILSLLLLVLGRFFEFFILALDSFP